jgi:bacterioferritin
MTDNSFSVDVTAIRDRARQKMERGPVTDYYGADPDKVVEILNEALATEIVCWMRYSRHAISASGINRAQVSGEFTEHAEEERVVREVADYLGNTRRSPGPPTSTHASSCFTSTA